MEETVQHSSEVSENTQVATTRDTRKDWQTPVLMVDDVDKLTKGGLGSATQKPDGNYYVS